MRVKHPLVYKRQTTLTKENMNLSNIYNLIMVMTWVAGIGFVSFGAFLIYVPLGYMTLGYLLMLWVYIAVKMKLADKQTGES